ncbi:T9SS type A sorting domain-containing protein [Winogradskyella eximia]|uniref:T9SS type A sorting domain-containing protein n=1 Tax=Winogradskyella eximia TaxID=262006 RepID=UPI0024938CA6|nr:T9SS type A sorting domain-containing protein [Winogradskyella eximia]
MKAKNHIIIGLFVLISNVLIAQQAVLCGLQTDTFRIDSSENIPTITSNGDGTVTLVFPEAYVSDAFANYTVYDFYQSFPNSSEALEKYYNVTYDTRSLIEDIVTNVPTSILEYSGANINGISLPFNSNVNPDLILALDDNTFELTKYRVTSDADGCYGNCSLIDVPDDFVFRVKFNYNAVTQLLLMETENLTPCGNTFSIGLSGGNPNEYNQTDYNLQLWESISVTATETEFSQPCHEIEAAVFAILNIACSPNDYGIGNISVTIDSENQSIRFNRPNMVFGEHVVEFSRANLSVVDETLQVMKPFEIEGNPYLQISNLNNQSISVDIYNTSGKYITQVKSFEENSLNISDLSVGLYFIRISNLNNQQKIFKFLKN